MKLTNYFDDILEIQKLKNFRFSDILRQPADSFLISSTQLNLNYEFNSEVEELYSYADGAIHRQFRNNLLCLIPFYDFLSLQEAIEYYRATITQSHYFYNAKKEFSPGNNLFPFLEEDGGDCYWVDLNKNTENYNKIYWTTTLAQEPDYLFNSLGSMFKTISECYSNNIFFLDPNGNLDCDYSAWGLVAQKNNPNLDYWVSYNNG